MDLEMQLMEIQFLSPFTHYYRICLTLLCLQAVTGVIMSVYFIAIIIAGCIRIDFRSVFNRPVIQKNDIFSSEIMFGV